MNTATTGICRRSACGNLIPPSLATEAVCLNHFLDDAFRRTDEAMERYREGRPIDSSRLERLLADALAIVNNLEEGASDPQPEDRERMLELLLSLANLHEYAAHHSISLGPAS
jgi:hypothetical protein